MQSSTTPDPGYQWESDKLTANQNELKHMMKLHRNQQPIVIQILYTRLRMFMFSDVKSTIYFCILDGALASWQTIHQG